MTSALSTTGKRTSDDTKGAYGAERSKRTVCSSTASAPSTLVKR